MWTRRNCVQLEEAPVTSFHRGDRHGAVMLLANRDLNWLGMSALPAVVDQLLRERLRPESKRHSEICRPFRVAQVLEHGHADGRGPSSAPPPTPVTSRPAIRPRPTCATRPVLIDQSGYGSNNDQPDRCWGIQ